MHSLCKILRKMPPRARRSVKKETIKFNHGGQSINQSFNQSAIKTEPIDRIPALEYPISQSFDLPINQSINPATSLYESSPQFNQSINQSISSPTFQQNRGFASQSNDRKPIKSQSINQSDERKSPPSNQSTNQSINQSRPPGELPFPYPWPPSIFGSYCIHRIESAMKCSFVRPLIEAKTTLKFGHPYFILKRQGSLKIDFALPKNPELMKNDPMINQSINQSTTVEPSASYWWNKRQVLILTCSEIGDVIAFANQSKARQLLIGDQSINQNQSFDETEVSTRLEINRLIDSQGFQWIFTQSSYTIRGKIFHSQPIKLSMTMGEFEVLLSLCKNALPQLTGLASIYPEIQGQS